MMEEAKKACIIQNVDDETSWEAYIWNTEKQMKKWNMRRRW